MDFPAVQSEMLLHTAKMPAQSPKGARMRQSVRQRFGKAGKERSLEMVFNKSFGLSKRRGELDVSKPEFPIVPGGVYGGARRFCGKKFHFSEQNRFCAVFALGNLGDFSKNWSVQWKC